MFNKKNKKIISEVKFNILDNCIIRNKTATKVFRFSSIQSLYDYLTDIGPEIKYKALINYGKDAFYLLKTDISQKKKKNKSYELEPNQISSLEIAELYKSFFSQQKMNTSTKRLKQEIAPVSFYVSNDYIKTEDRYINTLVIEHIDNSCSMKKILSDTNSWLSLDFYKVDRELILNRLEQMKENDDLESKLSDTILRKIDSVVEILEKEDIFQAEVKIMSSDNDLKNLKSKIKNIVNELYEQYCSCYLPNEKINVRKTFEKSIYPALKTDIIHSLSSNNLVNIIGGNEYV